MNVVCKLTGMTIKIKPAARNSILLALSPQWALALALVMILVLVLALSPQWALALALVMVLVLVLVLSPQWALALVMVLVLVLVLSPQWALVLVLLKPPLVPIPPPLRPSPVACTLTLEKPLAEELAALGPVLLALELCLRRQPKRQMQLVHPSTTKRRSVAKSKFCTNSSNVIN
jgi:hypothetical protein